MTGEGEKDRAERKNKYCGESKSVHVIAFFFTSLYQQNSPCHPDDRIIPCTLNTDKFNCDGAQFFLSPVMLEM